VISSRPTEDYGELTYNQTFRAGADCPVKLRPYLAGAGSSSSGAHSSNTLRRPRRMLTLPQKARELPLN
jgi:hypothetical protein